MSIMRNQPRPDFVARVIGVLPADGTPISSRSVFFALGEISTPAYVRTVLRQLAISGQVIATGPSGQRVYQRLPPQQEIGVDREQPVMTQNPTMMLMIDKKSPGRLLDSVTHGWTSVSALQSRSGRAPGAPPPRTVRRDAPS